MAEWLNAPVLKTGNCNRFWGSNPCLSALPFSITVVRLFLVQFVEVQILEGQLKLYYMLLGYYVICIIYCFYQLNKKYNQRGLDYSSPEMDAIMVLIMAWVLAPVDVSLTWIRMVKEAEEARIRQSKKEFHLDALKKLGKF